MHMSIKFYNDVLHLLFYTIYIAIVHNIMVYLMNQ